MSTESTDVPPPRIPRSYPLIAWIVIVAAAVGLFVLRLAFQPPADVKEFDTFEIQARLLVGMANLPLGPGGTVFYDQAKAFNQGSSGQRLRFVVLAGELKGPDEALEQLKDLKQRMSKGKPEETADDRKTAEILEQLYRNFNERRELQALAASTTGLLGSPLGQGPLQAAAALVPTRTSELSAADLSDAQRQELQRRLGWFGDLALNPRNGSDPAARAAVIAPALRFALFGIGVELLGFGGAAVGFVLLILFFVLWRHMRSRLRIGSPFGGVYAETFAVWMVLFAVLGLGGSFLARFLPASVPAELPSGIGFVASLSALAWPVLRGVPWRQVRRDIGWTWGDRPVLEPFCGVLCYLAALPVLIAVAALLYYFKFFERDAPIHPIVPEVLHSGCWGWIVALLLASVAAPLLEETMFRGVLYRHLREATGPMGRPLSVILSALAMSFLFAVLHPQGLAATPVLMVLALGFTAAREWRGSLIPSMTVHGLHNGVLLAMIILAAS